MFPKTKTRVVWLNDQAVADIHGVKNMVEKRSEASLVKPRFNRNSLHFALPIIFLCPSLGVLTRPMCIVRHGTDPKVLEPRYSRGKSNNPAQSDGFAAAGLTRYNSGKV
jgi:hypothetical protein